MMNMTNRIVTNVNDDDLKRLNEAAEALGMQRATLMRYMILQSLQRLDRNVTVMQGEDTL